MFHNTYIFKFFCTMPERFTEATLIIILQQFNLPLEAIGIILAVDRVLDMIRTSVNVTGDAAIACIVAKTENQLDENIFNSKA